MDEVVTKSFTIEAARAEDAADISCALALNRDDPSLFQKSAAAIAAMVGDFLVARKQDGEIVGCAGLHRESADLAELYAVAVVPQCQGHGVGRLLTQACQQRAKQSGIRYLWLATLKPEYFSRYGFQPISQWDVPLRALLRKLPQTFRQPVGRWIPALFGKYTFMRCDVNSV